MHGADLHSGSGAWPVQHGDCSAWRGCAYYLFPAEWCDSAGHGLSLIHIYAIQAQQPEVEEETPKPTLREQFEQYKPVVTASISEDAAYRNACGHSDRENAVIEGNAAVRRAVL